MAKQHFNVRIHLDGYFDEAANDGAGELDCTGTVRLEVAGQFIEVRLTNASIEELEQTGGDLSAFVDRATGRREDSPDGVIERGATDAA